MVPLNNINIIIEELVPLTTRVADVARLTRSEGIISIEKLEA